MTEKLQTAAIVNHHDRNGNSPVVHALLRRQNDMVRPLEAKGATAGPESNSAGLDFRHSAVDSESLYDIGTYFQPSRNLNESEIFDLIKNIKVYDRNFVKKLLERKKNPFVMTG